MKRIKWCMGIVLLCAVALLSVGCTKPKPVVIDGAHVVIKIDEKGGNDGTSLKSYMDELVRDGHLTYTMENGMITSMNGTTPPTGSYWMLYTDDAENAVPAWGECVYEGRTYASALCGAETLPVKSGCTYIWYLQRV